jgi:hypothetical protein
MAATSRRLHRTVSFLTVRRWASAVVDRRRLPQSWGRWPIRELGIRAPNPFANRRCAAAIVLFWLVGSVTAVRASTVSLPCVADTTLSENYPSNNLGGLTQVNAGVTQNHTRNRGLFRFDVAGSIPRGSRIRSASLVLEVIGVPAEPAPFADFGIYRLLKSWGEGNKTSPTNNCTSCTGQGGPATTNQATWYYRFAFTPQTWSAPGGAATNDYLPAFSSSQTIYGLGDSPYTFNSTSQMVADVQLWLDRPETNFGWILICQQEGTPLTARRFGSCENTNTPPRLEVDYLAPPQINWIAQVGNQFQLSFAAEANQAYVVETCEGVGDGIWKPLTNFLAAAQSEKLVAFDSISRPRRFYRVVTR